jgi:UDP-2,3-diacylglucosamine hydrolase
MSVLFISDLHLDTAQPGTIEHFIRFIERDAASAQALYILGDLFEAWIGDDDDDPGWQPVLDALAGLAARGVACYVQRGNRDFLLGARFAQRTGARVLEDYTTVELWGERVLLMHGDLLCTDDTSYMESRVIFHDPRWQRDLLEKPLAERREIAKQLRERSRTETAQKPEDIMDVNQQAVEATMREHGVQLLLHGHTHRPAVHRFVLDGRAAARIVLGAWHGEAAIVRWDADGYHLETRPLTISDSLDYS